MNDTSRASTPWSGEILRDLTEEAPKAAPSPASVAALVARGQQLAPHSVLVYVCDERGGRYVR